MKRYLKLLPLILLFVTCAAISLNAQNHSNESIEARIKALPDVASVKAIEHPDDFADAFEIKIRQHLDHNNKNSEVFLQKIYLYSRSVYAPMVISTEGYSARKYVTEPAEILEANQLIVENRFFPDSRPSKLDWKYLTSEQCAADLHHVTATFKKIYGGKWVSTGISKGGQTCLFYRYYYPEDVSATIAYVAPINLAAENPVINKFISSEVGTKECRDKITSFQLAVLRDRKSIIPMVKEVAKKKKYRFAGGIQSAFEFAVLEYPFSFWQWGQSNCDEIPSANAPAEKLFDELNKVSGFGLFSEQQGRYFAPLYYQSFTELGYYNFNYNSPEVLGLIKSSPLPSYRQFLPRDVQAVYRPEVLQKIHEWLLTKGTNIIYVNGGNDPWSGGAGMRLDGETNSFEVVKAGGTHATRIRDLSVPDKGKVYDSLAEWLGIVIKR